ncbi:MAG: PqqD family peptide modification chaperone [Planctomycetota bacterium]
MRPRLRTTVQIHRQQFRGRTWHVAQDAASNQFFRLNRSGYRFVGMLDGRRTVAQAWNQCNEQLGDDAPTQPEVIRLLGQLYTSNMLHCEIPGDVEALFRRYHKRIQREIRGRLASFLFIKIPLFDPDHILERWVGVFGKLVTWFGAAGVAVALAFGLFSLAGREKELFDGSAGVLSQDNLVWLYACFVVTKLIHEFGHGFACKQFGRVNRSGGEVHEMGIMLLVFTPVPYVDASSSWAFRSKWQRIVVAAAGMLVEFTIAGAAAIVWANTSQGTLTHALAFNVIFIAGVSTLLFNGNPLLRYDGYYILSDLLEIPNLAQRSRQYLYDLVKRYAFGTKGPRQPVAPNERPWLVSYAIASTVYRTFICIFILLFVAERLFFVGMLLAIAAIVTWVILPLGRFVRYLASSGELTRVRFRAVCATSAFLAAVGAIIGVVPLPDHVRAEGVVEPCELAVVYAATDGFVQTVTPSGLRVAPTAPPLVQAGNMGLATRSRELQSERDRISIRRRQALRDNDVPAVQVLDEQLAALDDQIQRTESEIRTLAVHAPLVGTWVAPDIKDAIGAYVRRGQPVGTVANLEDFVVRATANQYKAALLLTEAFKEVEIRAKSRPDIEVSGTILDILPAGQKELPSAALGLFAGGEVEIATDDPTGTKAAEAFFEIRIDPNSVQRLLAGQRVVVRFALAPKPVGAQWWRSIAQLIQRRFRV